MECTTVHVVKIDSGNAEAALAVGFAGQEGGCSKGLKIVQEGRTGRP